MATKIYKNSANCIIDTGSGLPKIIPTAHTRFTVSGTHVMISDIYQPAQGFSVAYGDLQNENGTPIGGQQACIDYLSKFVGSFNFGGTSGGTGFTLWNYTAQNYTDLTTNVAPTALDGEIAYLYNSQGMKWLPGSIGGTYWPSGFYIYNGGTAEWNIDKTLESVAEQLHLNIEDINDLEATRLQSIVAGTNITVDNTDPLNPIVSSTGGSGIDYDYSMEEEFANGVIPPGWTQATSGVPVTVVYTTAYSDKMIGRVRINGAGPAASFGSITFANGYNYILNFLDSKWTKWKTRILRNPADVGVFIVGLANNGGSLVPSSFGNVIAICHDRNNMTGVNPGLITNLFVWVKNASGQTIYNTGVAPTNGLQIVEFEYNAELPAYFLRVKIDGVVVATVPNTNPNLFTSQVAGANAGLKPVVYIGKTVAATGGNSIDCDDFKIYRKWN